MKTITALKLQKKNRDRVNVFLDGEYSLAVSLSAASSLRKGQQLSDPEIAQLRQEGEQNLAYHQALHFLGYRPRSRAEVIRRLEDKGHDVDIVSGVLERLEQEGTVDDVAFARFWVENRTRFRPRGARALRHELRQKGVSASVIDAVVVDVDEQSAAWEAVAKRLDRWKSLDESQFFRKVVAHLGRRGFGYGVSRTIAERAWHTLNDDDID